jgi:hypothetical protein
MQGPLNAAATTQLSIANLMVGLAFEKITASQIKTKISFESDAALNWAFAGASSVKVLHFIGPAPCVAPHFPCDSPPRGKADG